MNLQQVHLRINDAATGQPTPVRLRITDANGTYYAPYGRLTEFATGVNQDVGGNVMIGAKKWCYIDGTCEILLPPGQLHIEITKGPEYEPIDEEITLLAGKMSLRFTIERWSDVRKRGWYSGDTRVHFLSPDAALLEGQAEDVAVVNLLAVDTEFQAAFLRSIELPFEFKSRLGGLIENAISGALSPAEESELRLLALVGETLELPKEGSPRWRSIANITAFSGQSFVRHVSECGVAVNTQNCHPKLGSLGLLHGHRIVYPLTFGGPNGKDDWTLEDWCDQCHRKSGLVVWTHPNFPFGAELQFGETLADLVLGKIDALEVAPERHSSYPNMEDYSTLCQAELVVPLVGASGKNCNRLGMGEVRTLAWLPPGQNHTYTQWIEAIRAGRSYVTSGPLLHFTINDVVPEGSWQLPDCNSLLHVRADARCWTPLECLELLWNGKPIAGGRLESSKPYHLVLEHDLIANQSGWLAVRCKGKRVFAHTSAVALRRPDADAPAWAEPAAVQRLLGELERMLTWAKEEARCDTAEQRDRLCHVFDKARTILAKKLSL